MALAVDPAAAAEIIDGGQTVSVPGDQNSPWDVGDQLIIGDTGEGTLAISNGGIVNDTSGRIADNPGSIGTVAVTGQGSAWNNNSGFLAVGIGGTGSLKVSEGAEVTTHTNMGIGAQASGAGTVTVTGQGSLLNNATFMTVGGDGTGSFAVENGGNVFNGTTLDLGFGSGATGSISISGQGSAWANGLDVTIGNFGAGALVIEDGGEFTAVFGDVVLGLASGGTGNVTVTGQGSSLDMLAGFEVGREGEGTLLVEKGAIANAQHVVLGSQSDGVGNITVTGQGSLMGTGFGLSVGSLGSGTVTIADGGFLSSTTTDVGYFAGSSGSVIVTGEGSVLLVGADLQVGHEGAGSLVVQNGGTVTADQEVRLGSAIGGSGTATVTGEGSSLAARFAIDVGYRGTGSLTVEDGGTITSDGGWLGTFADGVGTVTVTGQGSTWNNSYILILGNRGSGTLTVADGGTVRASTIAIGVQPGGVGVLNINGSAASGRGVVETRSINKGGSGSVSFDGGILRASESGGILNFYVPGDVMINAGGAFIDSNGLEVSVNAPMTGTGGLTKLSAGTLTLNQANNYTGGTTVEAGTLRLGAEHLVPDAGTLNVASGAVFDLNGFNELVGGLSGAGNVAMGAGSLAVAGAATTTFDGVISGSGKLLKSGTGTLILTGANTYTGGTTAGGGVLQGSTVSLQGDIAVHAELVFNQDFDGAYAGSISSFGSLSKSGSGAVTFSGDSSAFTGTTTVSEGKLAVNGQLGGAIDVTGGTLGGTGTVGTVAVASGGTVAPGNSIGTINVADVTFNAGSTYEAEINGAGESDLINAAGTATLNGGMVEVVPFPDFALGTQYTIVTAAGGVTGQFDDVTGLVSSFFLTPTLFYDANNVYFSVAQTASFDSAALTPNQQAAAAGADSLGAGNGLWNTIAFVDSDAEAQAAFDAISGEIHASAKTALVEDSRFLREAANARIRAAFEGVATGRAPVLAYGEGGLQAVATGSDRFALWSQAFGSWGKWDSDGNAADMDRSVGGFLIGGDALVTDTFRLGLLAGYSHSSFDVDERASSGSADSFQLGAYGGGQWGGFGLHAGAAYSWNDINTSRSVAFTGFSDSLSADYDARTLQAFGEAGCRVYAGNARFEPFANLAYVNLDTDGFSETGGSASLTAADQRTDTTFTTLGLRAETGLALGETNAKARGMLGWRHAFGDVTPASTLAFAGGSVFTVAGVPIARDALVLEAGMDMALAPSANLGIVYSGQIGSGAHDHSLKANLGIRF